eukprot:3104299-Pleurochrysis_carterae.AAC.1
MSQLGRRIEPAGRQPLMEMAPARRRLAEIAVSNKLARLTIAMNVLRVVRAGLLSRGVLHTHSLSPPVTLPMAAFHLTHMPTAPCLSSRPSDG